MPRPASMTTEVQDRGLVGATVECIVPSDPVPARHSVVDGQSSVSSWKLPPTFADVHVGTAAPGSVDHQTFEPSTARQSAVDGHETSEMKPAPASCVATHDAP